MKKIVFVLSTLILTLMLGSTALATTTTDTETPFMGRYERRQNRREMRLGMRRQADRGNWMSDRGLGNGCFLLSDVDLSDELIASCEKNREVADENRQLTKSLVTSYMEMRENGNSLDPQLLEKFQVYQSDLSEIRDRLQAAKLDMIELMNDYRTSQNTEEDKLQTLSEALAEIQDTRYSILVEKNEILKKILELQMNY
ncbi:hypothetical protein I5677_02775 [Mobilitalea sibirica]|uniref:Uncharacterized protein n=1 Tax=Mobilitalea sibirica TaxID=1462919 RepID=A0A8J7HBB9_9FIRM|nr:hypothetical protein [Mobilitalea sibirica]MBH1939817.1 hypothetical protein [Mobilitalea sibirica]